jgi:hypothetical protein
MRSFLLTVVIGGLFIVDFKDFFLWIRAGEFRNRDCALITLPLHRVSSPLYIQN